jgi:S-adenosylmethionine-diacylglycerol 3-amino-3-carboxypropyl transferase
MITKLQQQFFAFIHGNRLIYNSCWEDPRIDRQLLQLNGESNVVVITSAGCNVLDYLLDGPGAVYAVDVNFRQNALLCLKMALIRHGNYEALFALFGEGRGLHYRDIYVAVRRHLPAWAQRFWDKKIDYFKPEGMRRSFYWRGGAGDFAWLLQAVLFRHGPFKRVFEGLLTAQSLEDQRRLYDQVEPRIFRRVLRWLLRQPAAMAFIGVPTPQLRLIAAQYPGGLVAFIQNSLRKVFTSIPMQDNYFWRVYLTGCYTADCCPGYLKPDSQGPLQERLSRVKLYNTTVTGFLQDQPGEYTHFILLDHQDWLAWDDNAALLAEWEQIFKNSRPGTRILMRSAGPDLNFLPEAVTSRLHFFPQLTEPLHRQDRVGTYGSLHLAEVA